MTRRNLLAVALIVPWLGTACASPRHDETPARTTVPEPAEVLEVRVEPGDTLTVIARRHGVKLKQLTRFNGIVNPDRIVVGTKLRIPPPDWGLAEDDAVPPAVSSARRDEPAATPGIASAEVTRAADQLERAKLAFEAADFPAALALAQSAADTLDGQLGRAGARDVLARVAFLAGSAHLELGDPAAAVCQFQRTLALEPSFEPADGSSADASRSFDAARNEGPSSNCTRDGQLGPGEPSAVP